MMEIIRKVYVSAPFGLLIEKYLKRFIREGINPEIGLDTEVLDQYSAGDFLKAAKKLRAKNLSVTFHGPFNDLSPGTLDPLIRNVTRYRYEQVLRLVPVFRPKTLVCHAGYDWKRYNYYREEWIEMSIEMWSWLANRLEDEGTVLTLENVYEYCPEDIEVIFKEMAGKNVGFCFDIGHQATFSRTSAKHWIEVLGPYLHQLHIHDNDGTQDQHKALGKGSIDFLSFFRQLKSLRKTPPVVTLEPHREEDLVPSLEYLENIWPW